jgi:hypothetical protein
VHDTPPHSLKDLNMNQKLEIMEEEEIRVRFRV